MQFILLCRTHLIIWSECVHAAMHHLHLIQISR